MSKRGRPDVEILRGKVEALTDQVRALEATVHNLQRFALEQIAKRARGESGDPVVLDTDYGADNLPSIGEKDDPPPPIAELLAGEFPGGNDRDVL